MNLINPLERLGTKLCSVQNPASYLGFDIGQIIKEHSEKDELFNFAIAFPDVYSIGMCNQAVKIIYNGLNKKENVRCERVFAVEADFENLLKQTGTTLYTLETGMPLNEVDMIGFSIGYELGITGVLNTLELGKIPLLKKDRDENCPIVFAGGVGATNPAPFSMFFDAIFIGEAEAEGGLFDLIERLAEMKKNKAGKNELLAEFSKSPFVWTENMSVEKNGHTKAIRAIYEDFGKDERSGVSYFPIPSVKIVQNHGVAEIMRGCPNGCRFCHAGIYYRPQRVKTKEQIFSDVDKLVNDAGYREISLTSLSSADYPEIGNLLEELNKRYKNQNVSFQLPSLKVNSFTLPVLEQLSQVRKSGLTFAVETPDEAWQLRLNKEVYAQHLADLINEAKKRGWNKAKFYFMIGLPFPQTDEKTEEKVIVDFLFDLQQKTRIQCNVNVGTFIPKPHTAYQWVRQISPYEAEKKLQFIKNNLPRGKFHVSTHDISTSLIEGLLSRGDFRAGSVILNAYNKGCRLDAWENHLKENLSKWEEAFSEADYDVKSEILRERKFEETLPWDSVSLGAAKSFFKREWENNLSEKLTPVCSPDCNHKCGVCKENIFVRKDVNQKKSVAQSQETQFGKQNILRQKCNIPIVYKAIFKFTKKEGGEYISHLSLVELFNRAIIKSGFPVIFTQGFNPLPRLEFASTLSLGIKSEDEIASLILYDDILQDDFIQTLNKELCNGIKISQCFIFPVTNQRKRESLSSSLWGSLYRYDFNFDKNQNEENAIKLFFQSSEAQFFLKPESFCDFTLSKNFLEAKLLFKNDRLFRNSLERFFDKKIFEIASITKLQTLAKPQVKGWTTDESENEKPISYFELYGKIAKINKSLIEQQKQKREEEK